MTKNVELYTCLSVVFLKFKCDDGKTISEYEHWNETKRQLLDETFFQARIRRATIPQYPNSVIVLVRKYDLIHSVL